jgi:dTDP-4-dehydrorhamnose reductase
VQVVVLGAGGQLAVAIRRVFGGCADVMAFDRQELDITDAERVRALMPNRADVVINCAAYNAVDAAEERPDLAMSINRDAVRTLAEAAERIGATFVHYSSDFVFDGEAEAPYTEDDRTNPISEYGRSKAAGERAAAASSHHYILRLASVFGGSVGEGRGGVTTIDRMIASTRAGEEVLAFVDRTVTPSYTFDVARATRELVTRRAPFGIYHCVASEPTTWADVADEIARALSVESRVRRVLTRDMASRGARRPRNCALLNAKLANAGFQMPTWRDAIARHIRRDHPAS